VEEAMKPTGAGAAGWVCFAAAALLAGAGAYLVVVNDGDLLANAFVVIAGVSFPLVGALVVARHPRNPIGWLFSLVGLSEGLALFAGEYARRALITDPGSLPAGDAMAWLASWIWLPGFAIIVTLAPLLFPDGRPLSRRWRAVAWLAVVALVAMVIASLLLWPYRGPRLLDGEITEARLANTVGTAAFVVLAATAPAALLSLILRFRRSRGVERQQLKWFVYGGVLTVLLILIAQIVEFDEVLHLLAIPLLPACAGIAILRYRLYDIDLVINRSFVYGTLTALVFGTYAGAVALFDRLARSTGLGASLVIALLVAVLFQPVRERIQRGVNHLMYGLRDDPYAAISRLGQQLEAATRSHDVLPGVVATIAQALRLPYAAIEVSEDGRFVQVACQGVPVGAFETLPLSYQGEIVGNLVVSARSRAEALSATDRRVLEDLARPVGVAVHAAHLTSDLQRSRARLVAAREEERRRLRRDLHDGLGPTLAGVALEVEAARNLLRQDPSATEARLGDLAAKIQAAITEIRRLVDGLRPPALDELGLDQAIREQVMRFGSLSVSVEISGRVAGLPAAVEVAAYRIVLEAVTNAARHSGAARCTVRLRRNHTLDIAVLDDGRGLPERIQAGVGLGSMRERAEELGGTFGVERVPSGGTRAWARLPLEGG
jgi:signal transduction histidine kinase